MKNSAQISTFSIEKKTPIINDLVDTGARCNYGRQDWNNLHGFFRVVSLVSGIASKCFAVEGADKLVPQSLIQQLLLKEENDNDNKEKESDT